MKFIFCILVVYTVLSSAAHSRDSQFALVTMPLSLQNVEAPCRGGSFSGVSAITRLIENNPIKGQFNLLKLEPGQYRIKYKFSRFTNSGYGSGCAETDAGRFDNPDEDTAEVTLTVKAGVVYRLTLQDDFAAAVETLNDLPLDDMTVFWAVPASVQGTARWGHICSNLFPEKKHYFDAAYERSSMPAYVKLIQSALPRQSPPETQDRRERLRSLNQTDAQAFQWCTETYVSNIEEFDDLYAKRVVEVQQYLLKRGVN